MNQNHHHFQDRDIEVRWGIASKSSQRNTNTQNQLVTYEIILENFPDMEVQPGFVGGKVNFSNGQSFTAQLQESTKACYLFDTQNNGWVQLQQKVEEFQQLLQQQAPLQIPQQNQNNNEQGLMVEVVNYDSLNEYKGFISEKDVESQTEGLAELEDLNKEIGDHIKKIFDNNSPVQLKLKNQDSSLDVKFLLAKGKKIIEYNIRIELILTEQNPEEQEKRRKEKEQKKQSERIDNIEQALRKLQTENDNLLNQLNTELANQKAELSNLQQKLQQSSTANRNQLEQELANQMGKVENLQEQVQQNLSNNIDSLKQDQQAVKGGVDQLKTKFGALEQELANQMGKVENLQEQVQQNLSNNIDSLKQDQQAVKGGVDQLKTEFGALNNKLQHEIQQVEQKLNQQCQQLIQKQQNPYQKITLNQLKLIQQQDMYLYSTKLFNGQIEFELSIIDDDAEFEVGILADGDQQNLEKKKGSYYMSLPDGTFKRGTNEFGKFLTYSLQIDDKLGIRVDTNKHLFQVAINDFLLPPVRINDGIEEFSFFIRSSSEYQSFTGDTQV